MSERIVQLNEAVIKSERKKLVRSSIEETLNELPEADAEKLCGRGLDGVKRIVGDKCLGMLEAVDEVFPQAKYQRYTVHFDRNMFFVTPRSKVKLAAKCRGRSLKLTETAGKVEDGLEETRTYCDFPSERRTRIRTNHVMERLTGRTAAAPVWRAVSRTAMPPLCWPVPGRAMWPVPSRAIRST